MSRFSLAGERGLTLIELLAVMSIIGILSAIIVPAVTGSTSEGRDIQGLQDVTSVQSSAIDFFTAQNNAPTLSKRSSDIATSIVDPLGASLNAPEPVIETTSSAWPEKFVTDVYESEPPTSGSPTEGVVLRVTLLDSTGRAITEQQILELFTAIDFDVLTGDTPVELDPRSAGFLQARPANRNKTAADGLFRSFLWLFEKKSTAASAVAEDALQVVVFQLAEARPVSDQQFELVYEPLTPFTVEPPERDTTAPMAAGVSLSPDTVDFTGGPTPITVTLELSDDLSGIAGWIVELESPSGDLPLVVGVPALVSGTLLDGTFEESVILPAFSEIGAWTVRSASVTDQSGNVTSVSGAIIDLGSFDVGLAVFEPNLGTRLNLLDDDSASVPPGFAFSFLGTAHTDVFVNSNGTLTFGGPSTDFVEDATVFTSALQPTIAPFWDDLNPGGEFGVVVPPRRGRHLQLRWCGGGHDIRGGQCRPERVDVGLCSLASERYGRSAGRKRRRRQTGPGLARRVRPAQLGPLLPEGPRLVQRGRPGLQLHTDPGGRVAPGCRRRRDRAKRYAGLRHADRLWRLHLGRNRFDSTAGTGQRVCELSPARETGDNLERGARGPRHRLQHRPGLPVRQRQDPGDLQWDSCDDAIVGVSPGTTGDFIQVDYSADAPFSTSGTTGIFEEFDGPVGPDTTGEDLPGVKPFDLDGKVLTFVPNPAGGYTVSIFNLTP